MTRFNTVGAVALVGLLAGCGNHNGTPFEVLGAAPYDPIGDLSAASKDGANGLTFDNVFGYKDLPDARQKLLNLAKLYADHRDNMINGTYLFDVPLVGLAATLAVSGFNHFNPGTTLGLGVASAGVLGVRTYVSPSTRAAAYSAAEGALACLANVAVALEVAPFNATVSGSPGGQLVRDRLLNELLVTAKSSDIPSADQATVQKAISDLSSATWSFNSAPFTLSAAALNIVSNTTKRAQTGTQNINDLLKGIQSSAPATSPPASGKANAGASPTKFNPTLAAAQVAQANNLVQGVTPILGQIPTCTAQAGN
jgi:hypothetical protein